MNDALIPWYLGFKGTIERIDKMKFKITGTYEIGENNTIIITELPIGVWNQKFKEDLNKSLVIDDKKDISDNNKFILGYEDFSTSNSINIHVRIKEHVYEALLENQEIIIDLFKLSTTKSTTNLTLIDENGKIRTYDTVQDIMLHFYEYRLPIYNLRYDYLVKSSEHDINLLKWKITFIKHINDNTI